MENKIWLNIGDYKGGYTSCWGCNDIFTAVKAARSGDRIYDKTLSCYITDENDKVVMTKRQIKKYIQDNIEKLK